MGIEYRITIADGEWPMTKQEMQTWLVELVERHQLPGILQFRGDSLEIQISEANSGWSNVIISIEETGFMIGKYSGCPAFADQVIGRFIRLLASRFDERGLVIVEL